MANEKDIAENQEGKSLDQLAGEGQIADDETIEGKLSGPSSSASMTEEEKCLHVYCEKCKVQIDIPLSDITIYSKDQGAGFIEVKVYRCKKCGELCNSEWKIYKKKVETSQPSIRGRLINHRHPQA